MATTAETIHTETKTASDNQKHFWELTKKFSSLFLVSRSSDGTEHGRPMGFTVKDQAFYFFTGVNSPKVQEIKNDTQISITGQNSDQWIFAKGKAQIITDKAKLAELWTESVRPWFPKDINDAEISLICLIPEFGEYWDQSSISNKLSFAWDLGKAYVTGKKTESAGRVDKGEEQHSKVDLAQPAARG